ncbi:hypothetical protein [Fodinibius halophilus]|uniref:Zinc-finger domain-containing protein n=1 Tax=Fodinibius halophilus TaxID=1736908 RepID=A0A6M1TJH6_9BACT|nr:hypothetical protein [Fodinibius halophilus]NGP88750.1 hypothetical protein [Fodinibius halophilus]
MKITKKVIKKLINAAFNSHEDEIGCGKCFDKLNKFAELELKGKSAAEAMPLVEDHLKRCGECREEYEALLEALRAVQG